MSGQRALEEELQQLRDELTELRAVHAMHQQAKEGLEAIELQLAGIIHSAMDGIITIDDEHRIVLFNRAAEEIFQCSAAEALGHSLDQFVPEEFRSMHRQHIQAFADAEEITRRMGPYREISGLRSTGEIFPLEASISKVNRGEKRWLTVILRDISERKKHEERVAYLGRILDESFNEVYVFDAETWNFIQVNKGARDNLGYSMKELSELTPLDLQPEWTRGSFHKRLAPLERGDKAKIEFRTIQRRKDGSTYPVEVHLQFLTRNGRPVFGVIILDLTQRLEAERQLEETRRTLGTLLNNLPGIVYRCGKDCKGPFEFMSPNCQELTGYPPEAFMAPADVSFMCDLIHPDDQTRVDREIKRALKERKPFQISYRIHTATGHLKWVWEQGCGVFEPEGKLLGIEGYIVDVSQERALEDQLRKTERLAELGTLASGMAHEIGTPMNVILGRAELLMRKAKDDPTKRGLETIVTQVERITKIMNQLLSFARKRPAEFANVDLSSIIADVIDVFQERFSKQHIRIARHISQAVPNVWADADHMNQVLLNLILNACQAMPEGGSLTFVLEQREGEVILKVQDTGSGISQEQQSRIFDPFFTTKSVGEGTGLGLTVVHGIIQEHQGSIRVESVPGEGTTFVITLPTQAI